MRARITTIRDCHDKAGFQYLNELQKRFADTHHPENAKRHPKVALYDEVLLDLRKSGASFESGGVLVS